MSVNTADNNTLSRTWAPGQP